MSAKDQANLGEAKTGTDFRFPVVAALGGGVLLVLGLLFVLGGFGQGVGTTGRLGTGAFPVLSGLTLALLAIAIIVIDCKAQEDNTEPADWTSFLAIGAALIAFAVVADPFGLVPAVFLATVVASVPDRTLHILGKLVLATVVSLACWGIFIGLLDLPFRAFKGL